MKKAPLKLEFGASGLHVIKMGIKGNKLDVEVGNLNATAGVILVGKYAELALALQKLQDELPLGVTLIYKRFSPGKIYLVVEGEASKGKGC